MSVRFYKVKRRPKKRPWRAYKGHPERVKLVGGEEKQRIGGVGRKKT